MALALPQCADGYQYQYSNQHADCYQYQYPADCYQYQYPADIKPLTTNKEDYENY